MKARIPGITREIRKILRRYPHSKPTEISRLLFNKVGKTVFSNEREFYLRYRKLIWTEKWAWNRWLRTEEKGRLLNSLNSDRAPFVLRGHRIEWTFEAPISHVILQKINEVSRNVRPRVRDPRPVGKWYVIPNRNRMREFHDHHVTIRIFPKSGTVRILPSRPMSYEELVAHVEWALFLGGLEVEEAEAQARRIVPHSRSRTFYVGRVDPFKLEFYKKSLGIKIKADGSHPKHLEVDETFPAWIPPLLQSNNRIVEAMTEFAKQIEAHLSALQGIQESTHELKKTIEILKDAILEKSSRPEVSRSSAPEYEV